MAYEAKIVLDSLALSGKRLTTFELTYPRMVHAEFMTHRMLSKNSASSRAIPIRKMIARVVNDPVEPVWIGKNQPGMQAEVEMGPEEKAKFLEIWHRARQKALDFAEEMEALGAHKQIVNRILEPWMWITVIASGTEFGNLFNLRTDKAAQPEIRKIIEMACELYYYTSPKALEYGEWHLPYIQEDELEGKSTKNTIRGEFDLREVSAGRCARVSYLTHDGKRAMSEDVALFKRLISNNPGHWSPLEHVAMALSNNTPSGNFWGWRQFRKDFSQENLPRFDFEKWIQTRSTV